MRTTSPVAPVRRVEHSSGRSTVPSALRAWISSCIGLPATSSSRQPSIASAAGFMYTSSPSTSSAQTPSPMLSVTAREKFRA
jgi:hypothetical protein